MYFPLFRCYQHKNQASHIHTATVKREEMEKPSLFPRETTKVEFFSSFMLEIFHAWIYRDVLHGRKENVRFVIIYILYAQKIVIK